MISYYHVSALTLTALLNGMGVKQANVIMDQNKRVLALVLGSYTYGHESHFVFQVSFLFIVLFDVATCV